jgi:HD-GYP domain-containing protein (c-di-GMP phosphodiesterase class II)
MAMTQDRAYRAAVPREEALAELARHSGTQFDAAVVAALIELESQTLGNKPGIEVATIEQSSAL